MPLAFGAISADRLSFPEYAIAGATILDNSVLTLDLAVPVPPTDTTITTPIDSEFAAYIPNDTDLLIQTSNLQFAFENALAASVQQNAMSSGSNPADLMAQIEQAFVQIEQMTTIDVREDVLSWMDGDGAVFVSLDSTVLTDSLLGLGSDLSSLEFGIVAHTSDAAKTAETITKISTLITALSATQKEVTISELETADFKLVKIDLTVPLSPDTNTTFTFLMGANDEIFYFGTQNSFYRIAAGDTLQNDALYAKALTYALPNQGQFFYADDEGITLFGTTVGGVLIILAPAIDQIFANLVNEFGDSDIPTPTPMPDRTPELARDFDLLVRTLNAVFDHAISSTSIINGIVVSRATIAFK